MRDLGLKVNSTPHDPPFALSVISEEGLIVRIFACCNATTAGVMATVNVIGAGLRFTSFKFRWLVWPTRRAPKFTFLSEGLATSTCKENNQTNNTSMFVVVVFSRLPERIFLYERASPKELWMGWRTPKRRVFIAAVNNRIQACNSTDC